MFALMTLGLAVAAVGWFCFALKCGLVVADLTEGSGFAAGFYAMVVVAVLGLPWVALSWLCR